VILKYALNFPEKIEILREKASYDVGAFKFQTSMRHMHPVETYGLKFELNDQKVGLLTDTKYFEGLKNFYKTDILVISVVFFKPRPEVEHLSLPDAEKIISQTMPRRAILTHFGMTMLTQNVRNLAEILSKKLGVDVQAAYDGMTVKL